MSLFLTSLPSTVWRDILTSWLASLRDVVHIDCACRFEALDNPLADALIETVFRFPGDAFLSKANALVKLNAWMRSRKVYINHLAFIGFSDPSPQQLEDVLLWSNETLQILSYNGGFVDPMFALRWASCHLKRLRCLSVKHTHCPGTGVIDRLLQNNASTLEHLRLDGRGGGKYSLSQPGLQCPCLQKLRWNGWKRSSLIELLQGCPNLTDLGLLGGYFEPSSLFARAVAETCPLLIKLILRNTGVTGKELLQIARGCCNIQYLEVWADHSVFTDRFADAVAALPLLHTLVASEIDELLLLQIAARGCSSLRVLNTGTTFTCTGFWQITSMLPQLTEFIIMGIYFELESNTIDLFEYCGALLVIELHVECMTTSDADAVFESVAAHCCSLHTIIAHGFTAYSMPGFSAVLRYCAQLQVVRVDRPDKVTAPPGRPNLIVTSHIERVEEWAD